MSAWGSKPDKAKAEFKVLMTSAAVRNSETGTYDAYHGFDPIGMLYCETKPPQYDDMGKKKPVVQKKSEYKGHNRFQPHDKINLKLSINSIDHRSYIAIRMVADHPPVSRPTREFITEVRLYGDQVNAASTIIDPSHKDWEERIAKAPFIARRTPGWYNKAPKPEPNMPLPARTVNQDWVNKNIRILQIHWDSYGDIMSQNLFVTCDLPEQPASRGISALQDIFSDAAGFIELWVRLEKASLEDSWSGVQSSWKEEGLKGDVFRRFYSSKIQTSRRMGYIDAGSAIVQAESRPPVVTHQQVVTYNLLELTTRLGVAMIQQAEYDQRVVSQLNASSTAIKLLRIAGAGDRMYTGFLQIGEEVEKRLLEGDRLKISFRPGDTRQDEEWDAAVVASHTLGRSGEVILDIFRPRVPAKKDATVEEKQQIRPFVGLNLSKYTASPKFESLAEIRSVLNSTPSIVVDIKVQLSSMCTRRVLNGIRNLQHGGKQELRADGTRPWVVSDVMEALGRHVLMQDTRIWQSSTADFLGNSGRKALEHLTEEDHTNAIKYLSNVPTDKHGVSVAIVEGYPGVGKTYFLAEMIKALVSTSTTSQYLVLAPSNAPADVAALAIHSAVLRDALDAGEVIVRAHSTYNEASYMQSYALQEHQKVVVRVLSEEDEEDEDINIDDDDEAYTPPDISKIPRPVEEDTSGFGTLAEDAPIEPVAEEKVQDGAEGPLQPTQAPTAETNNGIPKVPYATTYEISPKGTSSADSTLATGDSTPSDGPHEEDVPTLATTSDIVPEYTTLPIDDDVFGKGEAIRLTEEELDSIANVEAGTYNANGSINVDTSLAEYVKLSLVGVDLTAAVNQRICPGNSLIKDPRFRVFEQSLGYWALSIAGIIPVVSKHTDPAKWSNVATLFTDYIHQGDHMSAEKQIEFRAELKLLREFTISTVRVIVTTPMTACSPEIYSNLKPDMIIVDEAGRMNRAEYLMVLAHFDTKRLMLLGDRRQLDPVVAGPPFPVGFLDDLKMGVLKWYHLAWWPSVALYVQRRSWKQLMDVVSEFSYGNLIKDGLDAENHQKHPWSTPLIAAMNDMFPNFYHKDKASFYFEVEGDDAIMDEVTKSWMNIKSASMAINIIEGAISRGIPADVFGILTTYNAQVDICVHALYTMHLAKPTVGFDKIPVHTCDEFQGGQKPCIIFLPVVSRRPGFVNDKGRLTVSISRATDCFIAIGSTNNLDDPARGPNNLRQIFDIARAKKLVLRVLSDHSQLYNAHVVPRTQATDANIEIVNDWAKSANKVEGDADEVANEGSTKGWDAAEGTAEGTNKITNKASDDGWGLVEPVQMVSHIVPIDQETLPTTETIDITLSELGDLQDTLDVGDKTRSTSITPPDNGNAIESPASALVDSVVGDKTESTPPDNGNAIELPASALVESVVGDKTESTPPDNGNAIELPASALVESVTDATLADAPDNIDSGTDGEASVEDDQEDVDSW